jgi:hypothetical protein
MGSQVAMSSSRSIKMIKQVNTTSISFMKNPQERSLTDQPCQVLRSVEEIMLQRLELIVD